ncbi:MAG: nitrous oxide reductase family maturation protein NosD [Saprospiraceae bacterium]|nr:nitrous oxide reductase family maturation protein NosD [Saprospiraceae bacterium]
MMMRIWNNILFLFFLILVTSQFSFARILEVGQDKQFKSILAALDSSMDGDTLRIYKGVYTEGNISIDKSIIIIGIDRPVLDGKIEDEIFSVKASNVTIKGLEFRNCGRQVMKDPAAIKVYGQSHVIIEDNVFHDNYFGIYLQHSEHCLIKNNIIEASQKRESQSGNGIHCFRSDSLQIIGNQVFGHRDGIYFEFVTETLIWRNVAHDNLRYGLHFMFSHSNAYIANYFKNNGAGVAVMYTKRVTMIANTFEDSWGDGSYGVLFKELSDCYLSGNTFINNTTGIFFDGTNRITMERNTIKGNGWGVRLQANCLDNKFIDNNFMGNTFDITTNGTLVENFFDGNYWDKYEGYDLDKDQKGDVPYHPLSLYAVIVEKNPPAMLLYRSFMITLLDKSEKILPSLTPENFVDNRPRMIPHKL